jgi:TetR/AcrR family transcriptional regulator
MARARRNRAAGRECAEAAPGFRRAARRRETEARILAAAEEVFAETGFTGASTAAIAERAGLPKANVHYYFGTKEALYRRVLEDILEAWLATGDQIVPQADPATALGAYIAAKVEYSRRRPLASKVFANELLHGAPQIADYLRRPLRRWIEEKSRAIRAWIDAGRMQPVEPAHLFFVIWAATQTYADFDVQVEAVLGRRRLRPEDYRAAAALITRLVLGGCGISIDRRDTETQRKAGESSTTPPRGA